LTNEGDIMKADYWFLSLGSKRLGKGKKGVCT